MATKPLTFFTYKGFRDSTGKFHAIFTSGAQNNLVDVSETAACELSDKIITRLPGGEIEIALIFANLSDAVPNLSFNLRYEDGSAGAFEGATTTTKQQLLEPYAALIGSLALSSSGANNTRDVVDTLYYEKPLYTNLFVFPSSPFAQLDTSTKEDYYYVTDGAAAFIGSTELQNQFLADLKYSLKGYTPQQLGKFVGGEDNIYLNFSCYSKEDKTGPAVHGTLNIVDSETVEVNAARVCINPSAPNYYLTGCINEDFPCTDSGTAHASDCDGTTLTATIINTYEVLDGGCCTDCDGYTAELSLEAASSDTVGDGIVDITVLGGTANYTVSLSATALDEVPLSSFTNIVGATQTSSTFSYTNLYSGYYVITIADNDACWYETEFYINKLGGGEAGWGCKTVGAVNYDASTPAGFESDALCVYCNASTGLLETGSDGVAVSQVLGTWADTALTSTAATSNVATGASISDGAISIPALTFPSYSPLLSGGITADWNTFNVSDDFTGSADASPYEYKLYKISDTLSYGTQLNGDPREATITGDAGTTLISTTTNATAGTILLEGLASGRYVVIISYTNASAAEEYEECYALQEVIVGQEGCTDANAVNYNAAATISNSELCTFVEDTECGNFEAPMQWVCHPNNSGIVVGTQDWRGANGHDGLSNVQSSNAVFNNLLCGPIPSSSPSSFFTYTPTYTNGESTDGAPNYTGTHLMLPIFTVHFEDGAWEQITGTQWSLHSVMTSTNSWGELGAQSAYLTLFSNEYICAHGAITHVNIDISYGTPGVWEEEYTYTHTFTASERASMLECAGCGAAEPEVIGCTDPSAANYDPTADISDNTLCEYPEVSEVPGCTDIAASNYDASATVDDGSCIYDVLGCTDSEALNYNAGANVDDGSCVYEVIGSDCDLLSDFVIANPVTSTGTNTTSSLNATTGLCDSNEDGTIVITFPDYSGLSLANSVGGVFVLSVFTINADGSVTQYNNYVSGVVTADNAANPGAGDFLTFSAYSNSTYTFTGLSEGNWYSAITYFSNGVSTVDGINADLATSCASPYSFVNIGLDTCSSDVYGCTDPDAINYNTAATINDGSCTYPCNPCEGECLCADGTYSVDCCTPDPIGGCTDPNADNFNANATMDDGTCAYPPCVGNDCLDAVAPSCIPNTIYSTLEDMEKCLADAGSSFYTKLITGLSDDCSTMETWKMIIIKEILDKKGLPCVYNCSDSITPDVSTITCDAQWVEQGSLYWNPADTASYSIGITVKRNDTLYVAVTNVGLNLDPSTTVSYATNTTSGWQVCTPPNSFSDTTNYLEKFISFAQSYCKDCGIPPYIVDRSSAVKVTNTITSGGSSIESNGTSFS